MAKLARKRQWPKPPRIQAYTSIEIPPSYLEEVLAPSSFPPRKRNIPSIQRLEQRTNGSDKLRTECPIRWSPRWADEAISSKSSMLCPTPGFAIFFSRRRAAPIFRSMTLLWRFASTMDSSSLRSAAVIWVSSAPAAPHRAFSI